MSHNIERRAGRMILALQSKGCRITAPRRALVQVLAEGHQHLNHAEILAKAKSIYPDIGRATVYRTLELLVEVGQIHVTYMGDAAQRFIVPMGGHHHHLVCNDCGEVTDLDECHFGHALAEVSQQTGFQIDSHLVEIYGLCTSCQR
jgi:Fe2+ or Zn2+ uptake regulation protein